MFGWFLLFKMYTQLNWLDWWTTPKSRNTHFRINKSDLVVSSVSLKQIKIEKLRRLDLSAFNQNNWKRQKLENTHTPILKSNE